MMKTLVNAARSALRPGVLVGGSAMGLALGSQAAGEFTIDATSIVSVITGGVTTISAIGIAVLSLVVVIKLFKWVQRVL